MSLITQRNLVPQMCKLKKQIKTLKVAIRTLLKKAPNQKRPVLKHLIQKRIRQPQKISRIHNLKVSGLSYDFLIRF